MVFVFIVIVIVIIIIVIVIVIVIVTINIAGACLLGFTLRLMEIGGARRLPSGSSS